MNLAVDNPTADTRDFSHELGGGIIKIYFKRGKMCSIEVAERGNRSFQIILFRLCFRQFKPVKKLKNCATQFTGARAADYRNEAVLFCLGWKVQTKNRMHKFSDSNARCFFRLQHMSETCLHCKYIVPNIFRSAESEYHLSSPGHSFAYPFTAHSRIRK